MGGGDPHCAFIFSLLLFSPHLGSHILPSTRSQTPQSVSLFNVRDQVLHPHKTTGEIIFLYSLIFVFLDKWEDKKYFALHSPDLVCS
jgi:hypothetical protein